MNPGTEFKNWPWNKGRGAESFLDRRGKFNHNYMERYWPKHAHVVTEPTADAGEYRSRFRDYFQTGKATPMQGIMYEYGDLKDVVDLRSEEHTSELQSLMRISYAVFCLKKKKNTTHKQNTQT